MKDFGDRQEIDTLIKRFFDTFDNRVGLRPRQSEMTALFVERAVITKHHDGQSTLYSPVEFAKPRIALLVSGELVDFHEWEIKASTRIVGGIATRTSRYAKSGVHNGAAYAGTGTKFFQLAKFTSNWRIVALSWIDDE